MVRSWKLEDDEKLAALFRKGKNKGGVDSNNTDRDYIKKVLNNHFGGDGNDFVYSNFAPLFRKKCAKWNLNEELSGARRGRKDNQKKKAAESKYYNYF